MRNLNFKSYKIASKLSLEKIEEFFKIRRASRWKEYITLDRQQLSFILNYKSESKIVYIFQYGCICFFDFNEDEIYTFLQHIESIIGNVDFNLFSKYHERHVLQVDESGTCKLWKNSEESFVYKDFYIHIICNILGKSTELFKIETDVSELLDKAEIILNYLHRGSLHMSKKKFVEMAARILRLEYHMMNTIKVFDRDIFNNESIEARNVYDKMSEYFELESRSSIIQNKMDDLTSIYKAYTTLTYKLSETKMYWLEVGMLALFPMFYLVHNTTIENFILFLRGIF